MGVWGQGDRGVNGWETDKRMDRTRGHGDEGVGERSTRCVELA
jgi:hypothetical protein